MKNSLLFLLLFFISFNLLSQNISLDKTFGDEGIVSEYYKDSIDVLIFDAKQFKEGSYLFSLLVYDNYYDEEYFLLSRYNKSGQLDTTFADNGYYKVKSDDVEELLPLTVLPSGFIAIADLDDEEETILSIIDEKGNHFKDINLEFGEYTYTIKSILYRDNSLYIGGNYGLINPETPSGLLDSSYVMKINDQWDIDTTFAENGIYKYGVPGYTSYLNDMDFQGDKILLSSQFLALDYSDDFIMFNRISLSGEFDDDFGDSGAVIVDEFIEDIVRVSVDSTGSFYFTLFVQPAVIKYTKEGDIDRSYGREGIALAESFEDIDLITFFSQVYNGDTYFFGALNFENGLKYVKPIIIKYNAKGELDTLFGDKGLLIQELDDGAVYYNGMIDDHGKILAFGGVEFAESIGESDLPSKYLIARYKYNGVRAHEVVMNNIRAYIHPNPTKTGKISFDFELEKADKVKIELLDINGKKIDFLYMGTAHAGMNEVYLSLPENIKEGMYFMKMTTGSGYTIRKLVVY